MQNDHAYQSLIFTQKSCRALAPNSLSQAYQQRAFQIADSAQILVPDECSITCCQACSVAWIPGITVSIRKQLGNSSGLNKRQRIRRAKKVQARSALLNARGKLTIHSDRFRSNHIIYHCKRCNHRMVIDLPGGQKNHKPSQEPTKPVISKRKKKNAALQSLIAKNQQRKDQSFSLQDFAL